MLDADDFRSLGAFEIYAQARRRGRRPAVVQRSHPAAAARDSDPRRDSGRAATQLRPSAVSEVDLDLAPASADASAAGDIGPKRVAGGTSMSRCPVARPVAWVAEHRQAVMAHTASARTRAGTDSQFHCSPFPCAAGEASAMQPARRGSRRNPRHRDSLGDRDLDVARQIASFRLMSGTTGRGRALPGRCPGSPETAARQCRRVLARLSRDRAAVAARSSSRWGAGGFRLVRLCARAGRSSTAR